MTDTAILDSIVGKRFGHIIVLEHLNSALYSCVCDCGKKKQIKYSDLVSGRVKSCGCMRNKPKSDDIIGLRSGKLVAIEQTTVMKKSSYLWRCRCDCGKEILTEAYRIKRGQVKSCGCSRKYNGVKDLSGMKFGKLTAIKRLEEKDGHCYKWLCTCDCGKQAKVSSTKLIQGMVKSCGCILAENALKNVKNEKGISDNSHYIDGTRIERLISVKNPAANNTSGCVGVCQKNGKWLARITFKGKSYYLGCYEDFDKAVAVRKKAEQKLFGEFLEWYQNYYDPEKRQIEA